MKLSLSCDDGSRYDHKLIDLLEKYELPCTFYVPCYSDLTDKEIKEISEKYEIGGHTVTHQILTECPPDIARDEIINCKSILENIIGKTITKFCYPRGRYNPFVKEMVKKAGFKEARTTRLLWTEKNTDLFETHTTIHVYQNPKYGDKDWYQVALENLEECKNEDGVYHLWMHSWEVERDGNWSKLEALFKQIRKVLDE